MSVQPKRKIWKELLLILALCAGIGLFCWAGSLILNMITPGFMTPAVRAIFWVIGFFLLIGPFLGSGFYLYRRYIPRDSVPKRIKPAMKISHMLAPWLVILASFYMLLLIWVLVEYLSHDLKPSDLTVIKWIAISLFLFLALIFLAGLPGTLKKRRMMNRSSGDAVATILELHLVQHMEYGEAVSVTTSSYSFKLEFSPTLASNAAEKLILKGDVSEKLGEIMWVGQRIKIRYCLENPRILLLDGE